MRFGSPASRAQLRNMVVLVVVLDVVSIAIFRVADLPRRGQAVQLAFIGVWTAATLVIVLLYLTRIRRIRDVAVGRSARGRRR